MHLTFGRVAFVGGVFVASLITSAPAHASPGDYVNCQQNPTAPECVVDPRTPGSPGSGGQGGGDVTCHDLQGQVVPCYIPGKGFYGGDGCWYLLATGSDLALAEGLSGKAIPPDRWYVGSCGDPLTDWWPSSYIRYRIFGPDGPGVDVLADEAVDRLRLPTPAISLNPLLTVAPDSPPAQVVHVPTWLWVDSTTWAGQSASASAGGLTVTARATPTTVVWEMGDGKTVTCRGPGTPWESHADPSKPSPTCGHTYLTPTARGAAYTVRATVTWEITWTGGGESGTRPDMTTTTQMSLLVVEAGALNTAAR